MVFINLIHLQNETSETLFGYVIAFRQSLRKYVFTKVCIYKSMYPVFTSISDKKFNSGEIWQLDRIF